MATINVQFSDSTDSAITSYFAGPQDPEAYQNQGVIQTSDARWKSYFSEQSASMQAYLPPPTAS